MNADLRIIKKKPQPPKSTDRWEKAPEPIPDDVLTVHFEGDAGIYHTVYESLVKLAVEAELVVVVYESLVKLAVEAELVVE